MEHSVLIACNYMPLSDSTDNNKTDNSKMESIC